tara:strand:+ start:3059 stop:5323 length:2265 start_codon:yes stop_codon:yes gene_type:complete
MGLKKYSFPRQSISDSEKDLEWCKENLKAITKYVGNSSSGQESKLSGREKDIANYNLYNGHLNAADYEYITDQYGIPYPAQLANFPLISTKIDLLVNEDGERPLDKKVKSINKKAAIRKENFKVSMVVNKLLAEVKHEFKEKFGVEAETENDKFPIPDDIDEYMRYEYKELIEEVCQDGLDYLIDRHRLKDTFRDGLRDFLVTGKVFYKVYIKNGDPFTRRVDPRTLIWDKTVQSDYLEDAQWVAEERWLTVNEVIDEYRDDLKSKDIQKLEELGAINSNEGLSNFNSEFEWVDYSENKGVRLRIVTAEWKSIKELKYKVSENKHDSRTPFKKIVKNDYKSRKNEKTESIFIDDIWEATEIAGQVWVQCRRRPNQVRSVDDAGSTPLSYAGCIHNHTTGNSKSLVDLLRHTQMLYNIVHYHIELTLARAGGKAVIYDVAQLPTNIGMDMQTVMYHLKTDGVIPINSMQEGGDATKFNQFQQVDFTLSSSVQQLINLKLMLEQTAGQISGVSPQREGAISQYEYVGNVQRSVVQSSLSTKGWFHQHNEVKKMVFERLCNLMKLCWSKGKKAGYVLGDGGFKFLNVLPDIALNDYGIFIGDSGKDDAMRKMVQEMSAQALQSGNLSLLDAIKVLKTESLSEAEVVLERGLDGMKEMQQQMQEQQQQQQQMMQEQEAQKLKIEAQQKTAELLNKVQVAQIGADSRIEVAEIQTEQKHSSDLLKEENKVRLEAAKADFQDQMNENESHRNINQPNTKK